jgi:hypothetical protein
MNKEKVYIEGRVIGSFADTLGSKGKQIHLISGDIVDVDDSFIIKSIEPQKAKIPQFVADVIEGAREESAELEQAFQFAWWNGTDEFTEWYGKKSNRDVFARAWLDGYEAEEEKRYLVKVKGICGNHETLNREKHSNKWLFSDREENSLYGTHHTRKELEKAGFDWVFDCDGVEVQEVE